MNSKITINNWGSFTIPYRNIGIDFGLIRSELGLSPDHPFWIIVDSEKFFLKVIEHGIEYKTHEMMLSEFMKTRK